MAVLARAGRGGHIALWRHLCTIDGVMYVMKVEQGKPPKNSRKYERWDLRAVKGLFGAVIQEVAEIICPDWMLNAELNNEGRDNVVLKWNMIAWIIEEAGDELITHPHRREQLIKEAAKLANVKPPRIRALLTRYFYYGGHKNALMSMHRLKGAPGISRFNITSKKMGKPNDNVVLNPKTKLTGRNMTPYYLGRWKEVLVEEFAIGNKNISEAYDRLLLRLSGKNRNADGEIASYPIAPRKLPEKALFLRYGIHSKSTRPAVAK